MTSVLRQFTIYDHPKDFPDHWVVTEWHIGPNVMDVASTYRCDSLEDARNYILSVDPGVVCLTRHPEDDPVIVETWL